MDVNLRFADVESFESTPQLALFDAAALRLLHGWCVDPQERAAAVQGDAELAWLDGITARQCGGRTVSSYTPAARGSNPKSFATGAPASPHTALTLPDTALTRP